MAVRQSGSGSASKKPPESERLRFEIIQMVIPSRTFADSFNNRATLHFVIYFYFQPIVNSLQKERYRYSRGVLLFV